MLAKRGVLLCGVLFCGGVFYFNGVQRERIACVFMQG